MNRVYIAAPFFNDRQLETIEQIKLMLNLHAVKYFSPKDESNFKQGDCPKEILDINCSGIIHSSLVIAVTDDKDVGTMWEAGFAYAYNVPIIYLWLDYKPGMKFNIMLAASGIGVCHTFMQLQYQIARFKRGESLIDFSIGMKHE